MSLLYQSPAMHAVLGQLERYARSSATVLLCGESGTGKELLARQLHQASPRRDQPYVAVNCAALSETLIDSELFGHESGAFTGAAARRLGRFEAAGRGTLFLDEVGELPKTIQPKLLRALEEQEFQRLGSNDTRPVEARVVAATNRDLSDEVRSGRFRADLFHRLNVLVVQVPPLRERREDIPLLARHFVEQFASEAEAPVRGFSAAATRALTQAPWPGNVRQLRNVVRRACLLATSEIISEVDLPTEEAPPASEIELPPGLDRLTLGEIERVVILARLRRFSGNRTQVAAALGVTTRTLRNKVGEYRRLGYAV